MHIAGGVNKYLYVRLSLLIPMCSLCVYVCVRARARARVCVKLN